MDGLAKMVGIAKNTLRKYLDYLESAFLIRRLPRVDRDGKRFQRAISFKVYLTAPCLYAALYAPVPKDNQLFQRLAENALVGQFLGTPEMDNLAYASWRGGSIDLLIMNPDTKIQIMYMKSIGLTAMVALAKAPMNSSVLLKVPTEKPRHTY